MTDYEFIKKFSKITVKNICKQNHISASNVWAGRSSQNTMHKIRTSIESEIAKLYLKVENVEQENNSLQH